MLAWISLSRLPILKRLKFSKDYFVSISNLEANEHPLTPFDQACESFLTDITTQKQELSDLINFLQCNKSSGPDSINQRLVKQLVIQLQYNYVSSSINLYFCISLESNTYHAVV